MSGEQFHARLISLISPVPQCHGVAVVGQELGQTPARMSVASVGPLSKRFTVATTREQQVEALDGRGLTSLSSRRQACAVVEFKQ